MFIFATYNPGVMLHVRYLSVSALEEYFAGKDNVDDIKKAALDVCLHHNYFLHESKIDDQFSIEVESTQVVKTYTSPTKIIFFDTTLNLYLN